MNKIILRLAYDPVNTIITVARKIPENILQEDPKLLMWYDQALTRSGEE